MIGLDRFKSICRLTFQAAPVSTVPFFWSMQYGKSLRYAGHVPSSDATSSGDIVIDGDLDTVDGAKFVAYYLTSDDTVAAVATLMRDPVAADFANLTQWVTFELGDFFFN